MPAPITNGKSGWNSRYWDCCKPSCANRENVDTTANPFAVGMNCSVNNQETAAFTTSPNISQYWFGYQSTPSACSSGGSAYTCYSQAPWAVCDSLAYGYAAVSSADASCGKCFQLQFDGGANGGNAKAANKLLKGKTMIVLASNVGSDVAAGQFDVMIPGGGMGIFTGGCAAQWGVSSSDQATVGAPYGGFLTYCQSSLGYDAPVASYQTCVKGMCDKLFSDPSRKDLHDGCYWYADWMYAADNPTFTYQEVACPAALTSGYRSTINTTASLPNPFK